SGAAASASSAAARGGDPAAKATSSGAADEGATDSGGACPAEAGAAEGTAAASAAPAAAGAGRQKALKRRGDSRGSFFGARGRSFDLSVDFRPRGRSSDRDDASGPEKPRRRAWHASCSAGLRGAEAATEDAMAQSMLLQDWLTLQGNNATVV